MESHVEGGRLVIMVMYASRCERINCRLQSYFWPENLQVEDSYDCAVRPGWRWAKRPIAAIICWFADRGIAKSRRWANHYAATGEYPADKWKRRGR